MYIRQNGRKKKRRIERLRSRDKWEDREKELSLLYR